MNPGCMEGGWREAFRIKTEPSSVFTFQREIGRMKKSLWNTALIIGLAPFLAHCVATGQQMSDVELRLRNMDTRMVTVERDLKSLSNKSRGQADIGEAVDRLGTDMLQVKGHLEENTRHLGEIDKQGQARDQQMAAHLDQRLDKSNKALAEKLTAELATLKQGLTQLTEQLQAAMADIATIKETRAKEATDRAMAAATAAREAEARAQQQEDDTQAAPAANNGGHREIVPGQVKKRVGGGDKQTPAAAKHEHAAAAKPATAKPEAATAAEGSLYDHGLAQFRAKKYKEAYSTFQTYVEKNPKGDMVPNARFWVGDCLFNQGEYELSILEYQKVIADYPKHDKAPAALFKQGLAFEKLKDAATAKLVYQKLIEDYPKSDQAATAGKWLKEH